MSSPRRAVGLLRFRRIADNRMGWIAASMSRLTDRITALQEVAVLSRRQVVFFALLPLLSVVAARPTAAATWGVQSVQASGFEQGHNATAIALNAQNQARIAYYEGTGRDLLYSEKSGGAWITTIVDTTGDTGRWVSLSVDSQGNPHISYNYFLDPNGAPVGDLKYATRSGGVWTRQSIDTAGNVGEYTSIALDSQGNPHISYYDNTNGNLKYARRSGGNWTVETVETTGNVGAYSSLALDAQDNPRIAYQDLTTFRVRYASKSGGTWSLETPSGVGPVFPVQISLDLDSQGNPHLAYYDQNVNKTKYANKSLSTWNNGVATALGAELHGSFLSLRVDAQDIPHLGYYDSFTAKVMYAVKNGDGGTYWVPVPVDEFGPQGPWTSLALDSSGFPHLSFHSPSVGIGQVRYAVFTDDTSDVVGAGGAPFVSLDAFPNPVRTGTQLVLQSPRMIPVALLVLDARGRMVRDLGQRELTAGMNRTSWDGRDATGSLVPAGIYFAVTRPEGIATPRKLVVVR